MKVSTLVIFHWWVQLLFQNDSTLPIKLEVSKTTSITFLQILSGVIEVGSPAGVPVGTVPGAWDTVHRMVHVSKDFPQVVGQPHSQLPAVVVAVGPWIPW